MARHLARAGCKAEAVLVTLGHPTMEWQTPTQYCTQAKPRAMREAALLALAHSKATQEDAVCSGKGGSHRATRRWGLN